MRVSCPEVNPGCAPATAAVWGGLTGNRLHAIADARIELSGSEAGEPERTAAALPRRQAVALPWALAIVGFAAAGAALLMGGGRGDGERELRPITRTEINLPAEAPLTPPGEFFLGVPAKGFELSRDGRQLVYVAFVDGVRELWLRDMRTGTTAPLGRTAGASWPFFSPDGERIGFFADNKLKTTPPPTQVVGGPFLNVVGYSWDITPDGERLLVLANPEFVEPVTRLVVVSNFFDELERKAPTGR